MNKRSVYTHSIASRTLLCLFALLAIAITTQGCRAVPKSKRAEYKMRHETPYKPTNVYTLGQFPENIRRVAMLPVYLPNADKHLRDGIQYNAVSQATRTNLFEVVQVNPDDLARFTGRPYYNSTEQLPPNLLELMRNQYAADAMLFTDITYYEPYQPIKVGVRTKLISVADAQPVWSFDDYFDAGDPRVTSAALQYEEGNNKRDYPFKKETVIMRSPDLFTNYVFATAYATMPKRSRPLPNVPEGYSRSAVQQMPSSRPGDSSNSQIPQLR